MCVRELPIEILPVLRVADFYVGRKSFRHELQLMAEVLNQHPVVPLDLVKPRRHLSTHLFETPVDLFKALVDLFKVLSDLFKALVNPSELLIEVLNEFLIHFTSGETEE